jgi:hypothetical protein
VSVDSDTDNIVDVLFSSLSVKIVVYVVSINSVGC